MILNRSITATVYIVHEGEVLLHMHKKYLTWFPVGGHIKPDEFPHQGALREAFEESGLEIELVPTEQCDQAYLGGAKRIPLPFCTLYEGIGRDEEFYDFIYIAKTNQTKPIPQEGESTLFRWFSRQQLQQSNDCEIKPHIRNTALQVLNYLDGINA